MSSRELDGVGGRGKRGDALEPRKGKRCADDDQNRHDRGGICGAAACQVEQHANRHAGYQRRLRRRPGERKDHRRCRGSE
jgi:hypothetical protein